MTIEKQTEKAVLLRLRIWGDRAPQGGFVSSMIRDFSGTWKFWVPKSTIINNKVNGFLYYKLQEAMESIEQYYAGFNGRLLNVFIEEINIEELKKALQ